MELPFAQCSFINQWHTSESQHIPEDSALNWDSTDLDSVPSSTIDLSFNLCASVAPPALCFVFQQQFIWEVLSFAMACIAPGTTGVRSWLGLLGVT